MTLEEELEALTPMTLQELRVVWTRRFGAPPKLRSPDVLRRLIAWRLQAAVYGDLDAETRRLIRNCGRRPAGATAALGTRLTREWKGVRHEVEMVEGGCLYQGRRHKSLSHVAREITGARWNGPRFFGLRQEAVA